jgi:metal-sulfur cluster biosynthetic enzyme
MDKEIVNIFKRVKDPETGENILNLGIVTGYTIKDKEIEIFMDFMSRENACFFCKIVAWSLINKISEDLIEEFRKIGFEKIRLIDCINPNIEYKSFP